MNLKKLNNIVYLSCIVFFIFLIIGNISSKSEKIYNFLGFKNYLVSTGSMKPEIYPGDYITIIKVDKSKIKKGDVVAYKLENIIITHKVIKVLEDTIITKGVANNTDDGEINKNQVVGRYLFRIPKIGYAFALFKSIPGKLFLIGIMLAILFWNYTDPKREKRRIVIMNEKDYFNYKEFIRYKDSLELEEDSNFEKKDSSFQKRKDRRRNRGRGSL